MKIRLGGVQLGPGLNSILMNSQRVIKFIREAEKLKIDLLCFPELCLTTYFPKRMYDSIDSFTVPETGSVIKDIIDTTRNMQLAVILPYAEKAPDGVFNTAAVIHNGDIVGKYRKKHIPILKEQHRYNNLEEKYFNAGNLGFPVVEVKGIKVGIQICFDRHFPEGFRILSLKGADIICLPTNSAAFGADPGRMQMWERLIQVRAYENCIHIIAVNKGGMEETWDFMGNSLIADPSGNILKRLNASEESIFYEDIQVQGNATDCKFFIKRRPEDYKELL